MTMQIDYSDFKKFANDIIVGNNVEIENIKELFDAYTTYMMSKKMSNGDIKNNRMTSIINNYETYRKTKYNKCELMEYYKKHLVDNFNKTFNPPKCLFTAAQRERRIEKEKELFEMETDDIAHHYKEINDKYSYYNYENKKNDYDNIISDYEDEEYKFEYNEEYYTSDSDYYYDEYYSDCESDYLSDEN